MTAMNRKRVAIVVLVVLCFGILVAAATRLRSSFDDAIMAGRDSGISPYGSTAVQISGEKVSGWPPWSGGTYNVTAEAGHMSSTSVEIDAIGVAGYLELSQGGDTDNDSEEDFHFLDDFVMVETTASLEGILGTELLSVEVTAEGDHDFYDTELPGGHVSLHTSVVGGF